MATWPDQFVQVAGPEPITFRDSRGGSQTYDLTHDMTKDGALNVDVPGPGDRRAVASAEETKK